MRTRVSNNKEQIFCEWRHRWVRLTPEEWVRQQLLHGMVEQLDYPASLIAVEVPIEKLASLSSSSLEGRVGEGFATKRCDAVVYNRQMKPVMLIECKAETVALTQKTLDQAVTYNRSLNVPYLILYNGPQTIFITIEPNGTNTITQRLPRYADLLRCE